MKVALLSLLGVCLLAQTTPTQAVFSYPAPADGSICVWEISESSSLSPLVHDVNPSLFPGSDLDDRPGSVAGPMRVFVAGKRIAGDAADGRKYSRALQANTTHYYRRTCGAEVTTGEFRTANIPIGNTYSDPPPADPNKPGGYQWPDGNNTERDFSFIDPRTGAYLKNILLPGDASRRPELATTGGGTSAGFHTLTNLNLDANGFYHVALPTASGGGPSVLYAVHPQTGEVRFLGTIILRQQTVGLPSRVKYCGGNLSAQWDNFDPNVLYCYPTDSGDTYIVKGTYIGDDSNRTPVPGDIPGPIAEFKWELLTPSGNGLQKLVAERAPAFGITSFDPARYACTGQGVQGPYIILVCLRGNQDTMAFVGAFDIGNGQPLGNGWVGTNGNQHPIVALTAVHEQANSRWCTFHTYEQMGDSNVVGISTQIAKGPITGSGPYLVTLRVDLPASRDNATIQVTSDWNNSWGELPAGWEPGEPVSPNADHFLMKANPGDTFLIKGEYVRLISKPSANEWVIERAIDKRAPVSHSAGETLSAYCNTGFHPSTEDGGHTPVPNDIYWDFLNSANGSDLQYYWAQQKVGGHMTHWGKYRIGGDYVYVEGPLQDNFTWRGPLYYTNQVSPKFAGSIAPANGNSVQRHPSNLHIRAAEADKWFLDTNPLIGGNMYSVSSNDATTPIAGDLYRYTVDRSLDTPRYGGDGLRRKHRGTMAVAANRVLRDISGPGSVIDGTRDYAYTYCVVVAAGECITDSQPGEIYVNVPDLDQNRRYCTGGENYGGYNDVCIADFPTYAMATNQFGLPRRNDDTGFHNRVLTYANAAYRDLASTANAKPFPDGSWALVPYTQGRRVLLLKLPPYPEHDGVDRTNFIPAVVHAVPPAGMDIKTAVIRFGYEENGRPDELFCTSRREACVSVNRDTIDQQEPFRFEQTEQYEGVPCEESCRITIPVLPNHVAYYQVEFRNSENSVVERVRGVAAESAVSPAKE